MSILLFQIYGNRRVYHLELTYSILSAVRFLKADPAGIRIVLASDAENRRPDLPAEPLAVTPAQLHEWQMGGSYNHAVKIHVLHHAVRHFDAPVILIDSDTIVHDHPRRMFDRIGPGKTLMHARESRLGDSIAWPEWDGMIRRTGGVVGGWQISPDSVMYNSGVLGLHPQDASLMEGAMAAMQGIRENSSMFTAEQLAASLVFAGRTELSICDDLVEHYWGGPRAYYHYQMQQMFPGVLKGAGIEDADMALASLDQSPAVALRHRLAARIKRLQRAVGAEYAAAYSAYLSALSLRDTNPDLANVWTTIAMNMLQWGMGNQRVHPADFIRFTPAQIGLQHWMQPDLRDRWRDYWPSANDCRVDKASQ